jgi:hypothetical protein
MESNVAGAEDLPSDVGRYLEDLGVLPRDLGARLGDALAAFPRGKKHSRRKKRIQALLQRLAPLLGPCLEDGAFKNF